MDGFSFCRLFVTSKAFQTRVIQQSALIGSNIGYKENELL
jgi:hypothetical protein